MTSKHEPGHLLVVDDNRVNRLLLVHGLEQEGHSVSWAENGRLALEMLQSRPFDMVLLDIEMPELNGFQVLEALLANPDLRDMPVIMTSASDELDRVVKCIEMGAEDFLTKPLNPVLLRARVNASLEKKRLRDQQINMMRLAAYEMAKLEPLADGERGVIISTSSIAAYEGQIGQAAYAASKAGIVGLTLPAARDLARTGIRVLAIAPGLIATPMMLTLPADIQKSLGDSVPFPSRLGHAHEFSRLAMHLIENTLMNGEVIRLDGALRLAPK